MKGCIRGHRGSVLEAARLLSAGIHHQNIALNDDVDSSDRFVISAKNLINKVLARGGEMICPRRWQFDGGIYVFATSQAVMDPKIVADLRPSAV